MKPYLALTRTTLLLALRERSVLFFNYLLPLVFLVAFGQMMRAQTGGAENLVTTVLCIGILGNGLFGAGFRAVQERETNVLRRYKVAPITPVPILVAGLVGGLLLYLPAVAIVLGLTRIVYHWNGAAPWGSLLLFIVLAVLAFRAVGSIIAAVANSAAEGNMLVQLLWLPMLFLSGITIPTTIFPEWLQVVSQFIPSTYLVAGMRGILQRNESITDNLGAVTALAVTGILGTFVAAKLFRWEKEEKLPAKSKLWVLAVLVPFFILGGFQAFSKDNIRKARQLDRETARSRARLIRNVRVIVGDGRVLNNVSVLLRGGKVAQILPGSASADDLRAIAIEGAGKTLLPGLIDVHVHLGAPGGVYGDQAKFQDKTMPRRELAAYLYSGVTAVRSLGDGLATVLEARRQIGSGEYSGAELFLAGPLFTAPGGHGTEYAARMPQEYREEFNKQFVRVPRTADEARQMVRELKAAGVDAIKAVLESGGGPFRFNRLDTNMLLAIGAEAKAQGLSLAVHTGTGQDIRDAIRAGASSVEHGSFMEHLPPEIFGQLKQAGVTYVPTLSVVEAVTDLGAGRQDLLSRPLVQAVAPPTLLEGTRKLMTGSLGRGPQMPPQFLVNAMENLKAAYEAGVPLAAGSDAGNILVIHGPTVQRELLLWTKAGVPAPAAIQAATSSAARLLRMADRMGTVAVGKDATLLLVEGDPLQDITALERISDVFLKGERIDRDKLFEQQ